MNAKILITDEVSNLLLTKLKEAGFNIVYVPNAPKDLIIREIKDAKAIVVRSRTKVTKEVIDASSTLKVIARVGVGLDNIDVEYAKEKGILVINAGGATAQSVAELTIGLMIMLARKAYLGYKKLLAGVWAKSECKGIELQGKTLGIIGVGNIGTLVGRMAYYGLNMRVLGYRRNLDKIEPPIIPTTLEDLLENSDIVSIHLPLTRETKGFFDKNKIRLMKEGSFLINVSRMEIIVLEDLLEALKSGHLAGFAGDINLKPDKYPFIKELMELPNVLVTPHIGAQTKEAQQRAGIIIANKIIEILSSEK